MFFEHNLSFCSYEPLVSILVAAAICGTRSVQINPGQYASAFTGTTARDVDMIAELMPRKCSDFVL